ncbi:MAG: hypothetical protein M3401_11230, partial [Actinomycetota bacterium]|nr:hypothetical protein [Actinomycetota bacterium]
RRVVVRPPAAALERARLGHDVAAGHLRLRWVEEAGEVWVGIEDAHVPSGRGLDRAARCPD